MKWQGGTSRVGTAGAAVLCAIVIAAYSNSFGAGFAFDSRQLILQDPRVHAATADNVNLILQHTYWWPYGESGLYRPLTTLSYLLNYSVLGSVDHPLSYHVVNLLAHLANVLLVWMLVALVGGRADAAFAAAAVWAVLPLSVEAVTNIVGRSDLFAASGTLGALLLYAHARRNGRFSAPTLVGIAVCGFVAMFSKESGVVAVALVIVYELVWWDSKRSPRRLATAAAALAVPVVAMAVARAAALNAAPASELAFVDNPIVGAAWWVGRLTALKAAGLYLWKLAWPRSLSADYSFEAIPLARGSVQDWMAWATVVAAAAAIGFAAWRNRAVRFFAAFAVLAFVPASNLLFATGTIFGERLMYLPSVGIVALAAIAAQRLPRSAFLLATAAIVVAFGVRTWARNPAWSNDVALWRAAVSAEPRSAKAHHALAEALYDSDPTHANIDEVIAEQERSVAIVDGLPDDLNWFQSFRQAGAYHLDKATALKADGGPEYERALARLQRAAAIERAGARRRGTANAAPEADLNRLLAAAYLGVHDATRALEAANRARDLDPLAPLCYRIAATARLAQQEPDAAAVSLMVGAMVTGDRGLTQALLGLYAAGLDDDRCATTGTSSGPALNIGCAIVQRHMCAAGPEAARLDRQLGRFTEADRVQATLRSMAPCTPPQ